MGECFDYFYFKMVLPNNTDQKKLTVELTTFNFKPKHAKNFQTQDFWSEFFKAKQINNDGTDTELDSFEWYADFEDLLPHF